MADRGIGAFDDTIAVRTIAPADVRGFVIPPAAMQKQPTGALADAVRAQLDRSVRELVEEGPWAPFVVELGISGEERHFWRTAETMQVVALALPHLSPAVRR